MMKKIFEGSGGRIMPDQYINERFSFNILMLRRLYFNEMMREYKHAMEMEEKKREQESNMGSHGGYYT